MSQRFPQGKNAVAKVGNVTMMVVHDADGEPAVNLGYDRGFMDLTDVMVLRDLCDELLIANEVHVEVIE